MYIRVREGAKERRKAGEKEKSQYIEKRKRKKNIRREEIKGAWVGGQSFWSTRMSPVKRRSCVGRKRERENERERESQKRNAAEMG